MTTNDLLRQYIAADLTARAEAAGIDIHDEWDFPVEVCKFCGTLPMNERSFVVIADDGNICDLCYAAEVWNDEPDEEDWILHGGDYFFERE